MAPCSPSPRLWRICCSCSTDSFTAASRRASSESTSSGGMWKRGTRARRRSTGNTRPIATPGETGIPVSFAKLPKALSQPGELHLQAPQFFVCLEITRFSLLLRQLGGEHFRDRLERGPGRGHRREPVQRARRGRADDDLLFPRRAGQGSGCFRGARTPELIRGAGPHFRVRILEALEPASRVGPAGPRGVERL